MASTFSELKFVASNRRVCQVYDSLRESFVEHADMYVKTNPDRKRWKVFDDDFRSVFVRSYKGMSIEEHPVKGSQKALREAVMIDRETQEKQQVCALKLRLTDKQKKHHTYPSSWDRLKPELSIRQALGLEPMMILKSEKAIWLIEKKAKGTAYDYLIKLSEQPLSHSDKIKILKELEQTWMRLLYETRNKVGDKIFAHGDIKLSNIVYHEDDTWQLIDFGSAHLYEPSDDDRVKYSSKVHIQGTTAYDAPEVGHYEHSLPESDIWAMGSCLYEAAKILFWQDRSEHWTKKKSLVDFREPERFESYSDDYYAHKQHQSRAFELFRTDLCLFAKKQHKSIAYVLLSGAYLKHVKQGRLSLIDRMLQRKKFKIEDGLSVERIQRWVQHFSDMAKDCPELVDKLLTHYWLYDREQRIQPAMFCAYVNDSEN